MRKNSDYDMKNIILGFVRKVRDQSLLGIIRKFTKPHPAARIFPRATALPEIPPVPLYQRGVEGDFRGGWPNKIS